MTVLSQSRRSPYQGRHLQGLLPASGQHHSLRRSGDRRNADERASPNSRADARAERAVPQALAKRTIANPILMTPDDRYGHLFSAYRFELDRLFAFRINRFWNDRDAAGAAAIQAASPKTRPVLRGRRPEEANEYLDRVRLGQTERGSFVLTLLSPYSFDPSDQPTTQATLFEDGKPFGRRVTENLSVALRGIEQGLEQAVGAGPEAFKQFADQGVSANLCSALARLAELGGGADISLSWSPQKPIHGEARLSLQRNDASVLKDAAAVISTQTGPQTIRLEGTVLGITERKDLFDGTVTLHVDLDGRPRSVRIQFGDAERDKVFEAFHEKTDLLMAVEGELVKDGQLLRLRNPRDFEVIKIDGE